MPKLANFVYLKYLKFSQLGNKRSKFSCSQPIFFLLDLVEFIAAKFVWNPKMQKSQKTEKVQIDLFLFFFRKNFKIFLLENLLKTQKDGPNISYFHALQRI